MAHSRARFYDRLRRSCRAAIDQQSRLENGPWRIIVVRNLASNGFSVGDGYIFVNEGAMVQAETESQLAAVLAHEIGHEALDHFCGSDRNSSLWDWNPFADDNQPKNPGKSKKLGSIRQVIDPGRSP
ncbi:MAG: M48 family metalloprotease [Methylococcales bacterium]